MAVVGVALGYGADAALSSAFVPVFSELLEKGERARAWRVASAVTAQVLTMIVSVSAAASCCFSSMSRPPMAPLCLPKGVLARAPHSTGSVE